MKFGFCQYIILHEVITSLCQSRDDYVLETTSTLLLCGFGGRILKGLKL